MKQRRRRGNFAIAQVPLASNKRYYRCVCARQGVLLRSAAVKCIALHCRDYSPYSKHSLAAIPPRINVDTESTPLFVVLEKNATIMFVKSPQRNSSAMPPESTQPHRVKVRLSHAVRREWFTHIFGVPSSLLPRWECARRPKTKCSRK